MALTLHNYFDDYPSIVDKCDGLKEKHPTNTLDRIKDEKMILSPLVDSESLFRRDLNDGIIRDKIVYVFIDSSYSFRNMTINDDFVMNMPIVYIGMGSIDRPLDHWKNDITKVNSRFRSWLTNRVSRSRDKLPYLMIYSSHMSDEEAKSLEADLIDQVARKQSPETGSAVYKKTLTPERLFNSRYEQSHQTVYSLTGRRQKR